MIKSQKFSIAGAGKAINEDSLLIGTSINGLNYFAIADGLGGRPGGEIASAMALEVVKRTFEISPKISFDSLFLEISDEIQRLSLQNDLPDLATTLTLVAINDEGMGSIAHVGDCRVFLISEGQIAIATKDQTEVQRLIDEGILTAKSSQRYGRRHVLLSALSPKRNYTIQRISFRLDNNDRMVIASDGFYNVISQHELLSNSKGHSTIEDMCLALSNLALKKEPTDDCSAIFIQFTTSKISQIDSTQKKANEVISDISETIEPEQLTMFGFSKKKPS